VTDPKTDAKTAERGPDARDLAARVLVRVDKDRAFAAAALEAELDRTTQLAARDRALATELVYGSLRVLPWLQQQLAPFVPRGVARLDAYVRACLVVAAYQLFFTRVPAFAAVSEAVDAVRAARGARVGAFANAVLRKVGARAAQTGDAEWDAAVAAAAPPWLRSALERSLGPDEAAAFLRDATEPPAVALRVEHEAERDAWVERLRAAVPHATFEAGALSPLAILARGASKPQALPGYDEGAWSVQEEGSQLAALAVGARAGERILDGCAGRGNKTAILARAVGADGVVDACDASLAKLARLATELGRLDLRANATYAVDWTAGSGDVPFDYDRVLVDAPCSGTGTLRRRPEIASRRSTGHGPEDGPEGIATLARTQLAIVTRAADHVRPGGVLVYVVCSVLREEGADVVDALLAARPDLRPLPFGPGDPPVFVGLAGPGERAATCALLPHRHRTDGYFIARLGRH
jgi:16S rRNA (cytosine967-C5)-methyltransferase